MRPELITEKARKLARLAADEAATAAERHAALMKLECLMRKHGLTNGDLSAESRLPFQFKAVDPGRRGKDRRDDDLLALAGQLVGYVTGWRVTASCLSMTNRIDGTRWFEVREELTRSEQEDFEHAWQHYLPLFLKSRRKLKAALKRACSGFIQQMDLGAPPEGNEKPMSREEIESLRMAMRAVSGDRWEKLSGHIGEGSLQLSFQ